jgi:hypothetical protein
MPAAALQVTDAARADPGALGQRFLRQARGATLLFQKLPER